jgi:hypothetical protein
VQGLVSTTFDVRGHTLLASAFILAHYQDPFPSGVSQVGIIIKA